MGARTTLILACLGAALNLMGCAGSSIHTRNAVYAPTTGERLGQVARQPLTDFNLSETEIPEILTRIAAAPYAPPAKSTCPALHGEIDAITQVVGPDVDPASPGESGITDRAGEAAWGTARGAAEGWIPFHGVVRELSGAAAHDRQVQRAILAGFVRRAYLRGLAASWRCP